MSPTASSYEDLFNVASRLGIQPDGMETLFLQMVMNVVAANIDDHNKNFSFLMSRNGGWRVSPPYDFTFTVDPSAPYYVNRHSMTINGKDHDITREDLIAVAARFCVKGASSIIDKAVSIVNNYEKYATEAGVPEKWIHIIESELKSRLIL